jgi:L-glyceraldehyde 3-phosphate reductase
MASSSIFLNEDRMTEGLLGQLKDLNDIASNRSQSLAGMALSWVLRDDRITTALIGASKVEQIIDSVDTIRHLSFSTDELQAIETILKG